MNLLLLSTTAQNVPQALASLKGVWIIWMQIPSNLFFKKSEQRLSLIASTKLLCRLWCGKEGRKMKA